MTTTIKRHVYKRRKEHVRPKWGKDQLACFIKEQCGACRYINDDYNSSLQDKYQSALSLFEQNDLLSGVRVLDPRKSPRELEYRSLFKLAVRPAKGGESRFAIGLFKPGTHDVVEIDQCPLHVFSLKKLLRDIRAELELSDLQPFNETNHTGDLRYIAARAAHMTGEIILTFVMQSDKKQSVKNIIHKLRLRDHKINSVYLNINTSKGNEIFGEESIRVTGQECLREKICDLSVEMGPTSFFQINPWQAIQMYRRIEQLVGFSGGKSVAWDLYSGVGIIGLIMARSGYKVLAVEENEEAVTYAKANAKRNDLEAKMEFYAGRVENSQYGFPDWAENPEFIITNPSRRELASDTANFLAKKLADGSAKNLIYVSCEPETLARDVEIFKSHGLVLRQLEGFDMFPQTRNIEMLAVITSA